MIRPYYLYSEKDKRILLMTNRDSDHILDSRSVSHLDNIRLHIYDSRRIELSGINKVTNKLAYMIFTISYGNKMSIYCSNKPVPDHYIMVNNRFITIRHNMIHIEGKSKNYDVNKSFNPLSITEKNTVFSEDFKTLFFYTNHPGDGLPYHILFLNNGKIYTIKPDVPNRNIEVKIN